MNFLNMFNLFLVDETTVANALAIIRTVIIIAMAVLSVLLVITIFMQPANTSGMGALDNSETYYSKNKKRSTEGVMRMMTTVIAISMAVLSIAFFVTLIVSAAGQTS